MFKQYIKILAKHCKNTFESMTDVRIGRFKVNLNEQLPATFSVATASPYQDLDNKIGGDFTLGFADEMMAIHVASAVAEKMGLPPLKELEETAADVLNEFMNILVGHAISEWDSKGLSVRFSPPALVRDKSVDTAGLPNTEAYQIVLDLQNKQGGQTNRVILSVTFTKVAGEKLQGKRVLVAEDSGVMRGILAKALTQSGYEVEEAKDGVDATEKHKAFQPDLTIMDLNMPNLGGLDAIAQIKESTPEAKFLILTSSSRKDEVVTAKTLNVDGYVIKPVKIEDFLERVSKAFG